MNAIRVRPASVVVAVMLTTCGACRQGDGGAHVHGPDVQEVLRRMEPNTGEESRRYTSEDGVVRKVEVVFKDGGRGVRQHDPLGRVVELTEFSAAGERIEHLLSADGKPAGMDVYRKDGTLSRRLRGTFSELYRQDGRTPLATAERSPSFLFTCYDREGRRRYVESRKTELTGYRYYGETQRLVITFTVFNGTSTPCYRQTWVVDSTYGSSEPRLETVEEFHPASWLVARTLSPWVWVPERFGSFTRLAVFDRNGVPTLVRYLDTANRVSRLEDHRLTPPAITNLSDGPIEEVEAALWQSPEGAVEMQAKALALAPQPHHLERLLVP